MKYSPLLLLFCFANLTGQQNFGARYSHPYTENYINLSYGETLQDHLNNSTDLYFLDWKILSLPTKKVLKTGKGRLLMSYIFKTPGSYTVQIYSPNKQHVTDGTCVHYDVPDVIQISVMENWIQYNISEVILNPAIKGDLEIEETIVTIKAKATNFYNKTIEFPNKIISSGVSCEIEGVLCDVTPLEGNYYQLSYILSGKAAKETYISILFPDFKDNYESFSVFVE
jgi:hypothetical protein